MTAAALQKRPARITLRDVINHMSHMEQRLTARLNKHDEMFVAQGKRIDANTEAITELGSGLNTRIDRLTERITALDEDLVAVMRDTIIIRKFVGMPLPEED